VGKRRIARGQVSEGEEGKGWRSGCAPSTFKAFPRLFSTSNNCIELFVSETKLLYLRRIKLNAE
jgi:hypothetical protein